MAPPMNDRLGAVRVLLETAPDSAVRDLDNALRADTSTALAPVRAMVRAEMADRRTRDVALSPVVLLCTPRTDGFKQALFPAGVLSRLWRGLREMQPQAVAAIASNLAEMAEEEVYSPPCDDLCRAAAAAIRRGDGPMQPAVRYLEDFQPGAAQQFADYLELAPLARTAIRRLPLWLRNMTDQHAAAVRLLFKDADAIADDASPRLLEILLAQTPEPWLLLRIISAVTHRGGDRYLSSSELAEFCERVLADIERRVAQVRLLDLDGGREAGEAVAAALAVALAEILEFEESLDLSKEGPWGQRIGRMRVSLSNLTEGCLKRAPRVVGEALPLQPVRIGGLNVRTEPRLEPGPDERLVQRALASLAFFNRCRATAAQGGYGSIRARTADELVHRLDSYIEEILAMIHAGEVENLENARAFLNTAADMLALVRDEKSAQIVRRRAAAAA